MKETDWKELCAKLVEELHTYKVAHPEHDTQLIDSAKVKLYQDKFLNSPGQSGDYVEPETVNNLTWYLLYGGSSEDGRGPGKYVGRTTDKKVVKNHLIEINNDPYSTGRVVACMDTTQYMFRDLKFFK